MTLADIIKEASKDVAQFFYKESLGHPLLKIYAVGTTLTGAYVGSQYGHPSIGATIGLVSGPLSIILVKAEATRAYDEDCGTGPDIYG